MRRQIPAVTLWAVAAVLFGAETALLGSNAIARLDKAAAAAASAMENPLLTAWMKAFTYLASPWAIVWMSACAALGLFLAVKRPLDVVLLVVAQAGSGLLNLTLKDWIRRARPDSNLLIDHVTGHSFPSAHSMVAVTFFGLLVYLLYRGTRRMSIRLAAVLGGIMLIAAIGASRIYLGVHYASDVLGGFAAGVFWLFFCIWLYGLWHRPAAPTVKT